MAPVQASLPSRLNGRQLALIVHDVTFDDPLVVDMDAQTNGYYTLMRKKGYLFKGALPTVPRSGTFGGRTIHLAGDRG